MSWTLFSFSVALIAGVAAPTKAALLFSDDFAYANGNLAGNGGGTGWQASSQWTGGTGSTGNLVADPLPGTDGKSIRIASNASVTSRPLSTTYTSGGATTYYISFGLNADPFQGAGLGQYAGLSVYLASDQTNNLLMGMPGDSGQFGFDWTNRTQEFAPGANELLSRVVFRGPESGGVLQDSVGEDSSFENKNDVVMRVESSPASAG
jgi:hypothetical protein